MVRCGGIRNSLPENARYPVKSTRKFQGFLLVSFCMSSVQEIETALQQLPPQERWEVARWLLEDLQADALNAVEGEVVSPKDDRRPLPFPDYSARRRRIFGDKVLPNMVLAARAEESW